MLTGNKFRLYPSKEQQASLRLWIGHQRFIFNAKVQEQDYWFKFSKNSLNLTGTPYYPDQAYSQFRDPILTPWLNLVPAEILRNASYRYTTAYKRFSVGLGGLPNRKKAIGKQSVMITSELFAFDKQNSSSKKNHYLTLGNKKYPLGKLQFKAHKDYNLPNSICITLNPSGHWFISFNAEEVKTNITKHKHNLDNTTYTQDEVILRNQEELMYEFSLRKDLDSIVVGLDRGVVLPIATSNNTTYAIEDKILAKLKKKEKRGKKYQRKMARQQLGSNNRNKTKRKLGKLKQYQSNVRQDFSHKVSHALVNDDKNQVFVLEDLKLKNMMAAPKPKKDSNGRYIRNGAAAKAGLNKSLQNSSLGLIGQYIVYKAMRANKLTLKVKPHYSSLECSECHKIDKENRLSQDRFKCVLCGHEENADVNASKVIKYRGIEILREFDLESYNPKSKKTARVRRKSKQEVGKELPEPIPEKELKPVEKMSAMLDGGPSKVQCSRKQETPTISNLL